MIHNFFSTPDPASCFIIGIGVGAFTAFVLTLSFAGKLKWRLGFNEAEHSNLHSAISEAEVLKIRLERMSTNFIAMDREARRLRKLYAETCRQLAEARASKERDEANEADERQLTEEQEAVRDAMREQVSRIEASGEDKRAYTR